MGEDMNYALGRGKLYLNDLEFASIDKIEDISFKNGAIPEYITNIYCPVSTNEEYSIECEIDARLFSRIMGVDLSRVGDFTVECKSPYQVQIRRNKKKRINKKWAKRYGYKTRFNKIQITDVKLISDVNESEFVGRGLSYIY